MEYTKKIDGFNITCVASSTEEREKDLVDLTVTYMAGEEIFASSVTYKGVSKNDVEKVKAKLLDITQYNSGVESQCQAVALPTLILLVENIVCNK